VFAGRRDAARLAEMRSLGAVCGHPVVFSNQSIKSDLNIWEGETYSLTFVSHATMHGTKLVEDWARLCSLRTWADSCSSLTRTRCTKTSRWGGPPRRSSDDARAISTSVVISETHVRYALDGARGASGSSGISGQSASARSADLEATPAVRQYGDQDPWSPAVLWARGGARLLNARSDARPGVNPGNCSGVMEASASRSAARVATPSFGNAR